MVGTNKTKTSLAKFEEFFSTQYKDEVFEILEKYPEERTLIVDYNNLYNFDQDLGELLIEKPNEVLVASQNAIKNIDPLMKDAKLNVRFKNITNIIPLNKVSSRHIGQFVRFRGIISNLKEVYSKMETGVFECRGCMRLHEIKQDTRGVILEPIMCNECGGRSFRLLQGESKYIDSQIGTIKDILINPTLRDEVKELTIVLEEDLAGKLREKDVVCLTGILKTYRKSDTFNLYLTVNHIEFLEKWGEIDLENISTEFTNDRNDPRNNTWRNEVLHRDKVCQCCGLDKRLEAHHINGFEEYPDLRFDVGNGITLCQFCHAKYHSVFGLKEINSAKFAKFLTQFGGGGIINQPIIEDNSQDINNEEDLNGSENLKYYEKSKKHFRSNIEMILYLIENIEFEKGYADYDEIKYKSDILNINEEFLKKSILQLKEKRLIYECQRGKFKGVPYD